MLHDSPLLDAIASESVRTISEVTVSELTNLSWSFAKLHLLDETLFDSLASRSLMRLNEFQAQNCSNMAWALARVAVENEPLLAALSSRSIPLISMSAFNPQDLTNTVWALATMRRQDMPLLAAIASASVSKLQECKPQDLSNTAWAFAKLVVADIPLMEAIASESLPRLSVFDPQNHANLAWAFATLRVSDLPLLDAIAAESIANMKQFGPQELSNPAWAFANLLYVNAPLLHALASKAITTLRSGSTQNLTNTVWAFAQIKFKNNTLFNSLAKEVVANLSAFRPRDISITAWSYARCEMRDDHLLDAIASAALSKMNEFEGRPQEISNLVWAEALLDMRHCPLLDALSSAAMRTISAPYSTQELTNLSWSYASLKVCNEPLLQALASEAISRIIDCRISDAAGRVTTQNLVNTAWALDTLGGFDRRNRTGWDGSSAASLRQVFENFLAASEGSLGVEWVTLAAIAAKHGAQAAPPAFWDSFRGRLLGPTMSRLGGLRAACDDDSAAAALRELQDWVVRWQLPHLGAGHTDDALRAAGAIPVSREEAWVAAAREEVLRVSWWSCPHAAVSSQGVVAWLSADVEVLGAPQVIEPGVIYFADDSAEHALLVERMLQPIFLQVPRNGHAERRALVAVLRAVVRAHGQAGGGVGGGVGGWQNSVRGVIRLFASHYLCISCLVVVAQFCRLLPQVRTEVAYDNAWEDWQERAAPPGASAGSSSFGQPPASRPTVLPSSAAGAGAPAEVVLIVGRAG